MATRFTTIHDRYQVGTQYGFDPAGEQTLRAALAHAQHLASQTQLSVVIYDVMAHPGCKREWEVTPDGRATIVAYRARRAAIAKAIG